MHFGECLFEIKKTDQLEHVQIVTNLKDKNASRLIWKVAKVDNADQMTISISFNCVTTQFPIAAGFLHRPAFGNIPVRMMVETFNMNTGEVLDCSYVLVSF